MNIYMLKDVYSLRLLSKLQARNEKASEVDFHKVDMQNVEKAIDFCKKYHNGQFRDSGEPFYTHPLEVASMVSDFSFKTDVIVAAILHDIIEDTAVTVGKVLDTFGWRIAEMVDMLTRERPDGTKLSVKEILFNAYNKGDFEVLLIKTIDRMHNMKTINVKDPEKIKSIVNDTLKNFLFFSEIMDLSLLGDDLYKECYNANMRLGVIEDNHFHRLGRDTFKLPYPTL